MQCQLDLRSCSIIVAKCTANQQTLPLPSTAAPQCSAPSPFTVPAAVVPVFWKTPADSGGLCGGAVEKGSPPLFLERRAEPSKRAAQGASHDAWLVNVCVSLSLTLQRADVASRTQHPRDLAEVVAPRLCRPRFNTSTCPAQRTSFSHPPPNLPAPCGMEGGCGLADTYIWHI